MIRECLLRYLWGPNNQALRYEPDTNFTDLKIVTEFWKRADTHGKDPENPSEIQLDDEFHPFTERIGPPPSE
jgi:hypothetical protein